MLTCWKAQRSDAVHHLSTKHAGVKKAMLSSKSQGQRSGDKTDNALKQNTARNFREIYVHVYTHHKTDPQPARNTDRLILTLRTCVECSELHCKWTELRPSEMNGGFVSIDTQPYSVNYCNNWAGRLPVRGRILSVTQEKRFLGRHTTGWQKAQERSLVSRGEAKGHLQAPKQALSDEMKGNQKLKEKSC